jgi:hypothetical protein
LTPFKTIFCVSSSVVVRVNSNLFKPSEERVIFTFSETRFSSCNAVKVICLFIEKLVGVTSMEDGFTEIADGLLLVMVTV